MSPITFALLALYVVGIRSDNTCSAEVRAVSRPGGNWEQDGTPFQLYDILK